MKLRDEITNYLLTTTDGAKLSVTTRDSLLKLFEKWALEMVGEDVLFDEYDEPYNKAKQEIRDRIKEATK